MSYMYLAKWISENSAVREAVRDDVTFKQGREDGRSHEDVDV